MPDRSARPRVSVVVNTNGRCASLQRTIESFRQVEYAPFELCVVHGPSMDGTRELVEAYTDDGTIRSAPCTDLNLSQSRNIGIALAAGEIVAFIDDDAIPEPEWLSDLVDAFDDDEIAATGGKVLDPSGYTYQYLYAACDRLGNAKLDLTEPAIERNYPYSNVFPYVQGTNAAFRRKNLVGIGGFDEEFEFYLDETDVCCRLVDAGLTVRQLGNAVVHHKFMPSNIRNEAKITVSKYAIIKNKIYFSLINNTGHFSIDDVMRDAIAFVSQQRGELQSHVASGRLQPTILEDFEAEANLAWQTGLRRGLSGERRTRPADFFATDHAFQPFPVVQPEGGRRTFVFLSQTYPPAGMDGVARYTKDIARAIGARGHRVHVIAHSKDQSTLDLEDGVWIHRLVSKQLPPRSLPSGTPIPQHIVNQSGTALEELYRIARIRPVHVVEGASWDCQSIIPILDGRFSTVTNMVTTLSHWLETHQSLREDSAWMNAFGTPMLEAERHMFRNSSGVVAASQAIARSVESRYELSFDTDQVGYLRHGLADMRLLPRSVPAALASAKPSATLKLLFVGRLELRKGIDVLLAAATALLARHEHIEFWVAGDDSIVLDDGLTARQQFERAAASKVAERVRFLGRVSDAQLCWLYDSCDIYVSPSRYESFGLIFVEAMMFAKPCVGSRTGGTTEVIDDGVDGLLCEPGSAASLIATLERLIVDADLRERLGRAGRGSFERKFAATRVVEERIQFLSGFARTPVPISAIQIFGPTEQVEVGFGETALALGSRSDIILLTRDRFIHVTFWTHAWSGFAEIWANGRPVAQIDLFNAGGEYRTATIAAPEGGVSEFRIRRLGRKAEAARSDEVIFHSVSTSNPPAGLPPRKTS